MLVTEPRTLHVLREYFTTQLYPQSQKDHVSRKRCPIQSHSLHEKRELNWAKVYLTHQSGKEKEKQAPRTLETESDNLVLVWWTVCQNSAT